MRKITRDAIKAFYAGKTFNRDNTQVTVHTKQDSTFDGVILWLHGNSIAKLRDGVLWIRTCGWGTPTTRERLSGLTGVQVSQRNHEQYLNGTKWENHANWTEVRGV